MASFDLGETVICSCLVKNDAGTLVDPATSMKVKIDQTKPQFQSILAETSMTKDSVGTYHYDFQSASYTMGDYRVEYIATDGTRITREKDTFNLV